MDENEHGSSRPQPSGGDDALCPTESVPAGLPLIKTIGAIPFYLSLKNITLLPNKGPGRQ